MNKRQKKKLYKKLCDKHNMPYSSYWRNRSNGTMSKRETKRMINSMLFNLKAILKVYTTLQKYVPSYTFNLGENCSTDENIFIDPNITRLDGPGMVIADDSIRMVEDKDDASLYPTRMIEYDFPIRRIK